ncbi:hypothetical protein PCANC_04561 [Puccinia coronata f. sp. avenae]|uniref:Uncharacterized protein n=1 Tax=Puccinia coronata f. sp. avenae TaxID=200324 RepID=A0A2N5VW04_9BASI|nr:hypothetical protein PCANC_04561 [Puccinia coronata f. sp. avenae]
MSEAEAGLFGLNDHRGGLGIPPDIPRETLIPDRGCPLVNRNALRPQISKRNVQLSANRIILTSTTVLGSLHLGFSRASWSSSGLVLPVASPFGANPF